LRSAGDSALHTPNPIFTGGTPPPFVGPPRPKEKG
jgi:hypothetical protein